MMSDSGYSEKQEGIVHTEPPVELCPVCGGSMKKIVISHEEWWKETLYIFTGVPVYVCVRCEHEVWIKGIISTIEQFIRDGDKSNGKVKTFSYKNDTFYWSGAEP